MSQLADCFFQDDNKRWECLTRDWKALFQDPHRLLVLELCRVVSWPWGVGDSSEVRLIVRGGSTLSGPNGHWIPWEELVEYFNSVYVTGTFRRIQQGQAQPRAPPPPLRVLNIPPRYGIPTWNVQQVTLDGRTNNAREGWDTPLSQLIGHQHPAFVSFLLRVWAYVLWVYVLWAFALWACVLELYLGPIYIVVLKWCSFATLKRLRLEFWTYEYGHLLWCVHYNFVCTKHLCNSYPIICNKICKCGLNV